MATCAPSSWHSGAPDLYTDIEIDDDYARKVSGRFLSANQPIFRIFTRIYAFSVLLSELNMMLWHYPCCCAFET